MMLKFSLKFVSLLLVSIWTITANASITLQCEVTSYQQALNSGYTLKWAKSWVPENFNAEIDETGIIRVGEYRKSLISNYNSLSLTPCIKSSKIAPEYFERLQKTFPNQDLYKLWLVVTQDVNFGKLNRKKINGIQPFQTESITNLKRLQQKENK